MNLVRREYELINVNFVDDVDGLNLFNIFFLPRERIPHFVNAVDFGTISSVIHVRINGFNIFS